jgi:hypothetical protein
MAKQKKTIIFIVEGPSDKSALEKIFKKIYKRNKEIDFGFTNGDITSDPTVTIANVENKIYETVQGVIKDKKLKNSDVIQVVQIFDMDGAYIPDSAIINGSTYAFKYSTTNISCSYPQRAIERNESKRKIINYLLNQAMIKSFPYEMYFMSCNLDHALYNEINLDKDLKQEYADKFYEKFLGRENLFPKFLESDVVNGVPDKMGASWRYIKKDLHSLERHTNLHIYFKTHPNPDGLL